MSNTALSGGNLEANNIVSEGKPIRNASPFGWIHF
jgi:hypothetical protein